MNTLLITLSLLGQIRVPEGFAVEEVARNQRRDGDGNRADGRIFVCEQTGTLRVVKQGKLLERPFVTLKVNSYWERGLIGVAVDPNFEKNKYVYVNYISPDPYPHHRIARFIADGDVAHEGSETILFEGDDQTKLGGGVPAGHQGGAIHFGKDGKLYVAIGEQTAGTPSQQLESLLGKLLRLNADGTIPKDNPFFKSNKGKYRAIWALGLRNPFTFAIQSETGRIFLNDVGGNYEELNEGFAGANYGWPTVEHGPTTDQRFRGPIHWYPVSSITGGDFCPKAESVNAFPNEYRGKYFFGDFMKGWIHVLDPEHPERVVDFATNVPRASDMRFAPDGGFYVLCRDAWVRDDQFQAGSGRLFRVRYRPGSTAPPKTDTTPKTIAPFAKTPTFSPASGTYTGSIAARLNLGGVGDVARYTLDGSEPNSESAKYERPIRIDRSSTIRGGISTHRERPSVHRRAHGMKSKDQDLTA